MAPLDCNMLQHVADIVASPPQNDKYGTIKEKLIAVYTDSREKLLINELELGDK